MKVRVAYTVEATEDIRRAIRHHFGQDGLATRAEVVAWYRSNGTSGDDDLLWDLTAQDRDEVEA